MKYKLLSSAGSLDNIKDCISRYFYGATITIDNEGFVYNIKGLLKDYRVINKKGRYRFEVLNK